jgi:hypothetical protein
MSVNPQLKARVGAVLKEVDACYLAVRREQGERLQKFTEGDDDDQDQESQRMRLIKFLAENGIDSQIGETLSFEALTAIVRVVSGLVDQGGGETPNDFDEGASTYIGESYAKHQRPKVSDQSPANTQPLPFDESADFINKSKARGGPTTSRVPATTTHPFAEVKRPDLRNSSPEGDENSDFQYALGLAKQSKSPDPIAAARKFCEEANAAKARRDGQMAEHRKRMLVGR